MQDVILKALNWRYAVKLFDPSKKVAAEDLHTILEAGRLAPSSSGTEPWKFLLIENPEVRVRLRVVSYDQPKVTDAAHLIVIAYRTDEEHLASEAVERTARIQQKDPNELGGLRDMIAGGVASRTHEQNLAWMRAQTYIPLGIMIETAALLEVDAGPMEGFDPVQVNELLGLPAKHLYATSMLAIGYRGDDPAAARAKVRREFDEVVEVIV